MQTTSHFQYLGVNFSYNGLFNRHVKSMESRGLQSARKLTKLFWRFPNLRIKTMIDLFDRMAVPAILYGAEIWGNY